VTRSVGSRWSLDLLVSVLLVAWIGGLWSLAPTRQSLIQFMVAMCVVGLLRAGYSRTLAGHDSWPSVASVRGANVWLVGLVLPPVLSLVWSVNRMSTVVAAGRVAIGVGLALVLLMQHHNSLRRIGIIVVLAVIFLPGTAIGADLANNLLDLPRGWRGSFSNPNVTGKALVLGLSLVAIGSPTAPGRAVRLTSLGILVMASSAIIATRSDQSLIALFLVGMVILGQIIPTRSRTLPLSLKGAVGSAVAIVFYAATVMAPRVIEIVGFDTSFTGRTSIWTEAVGAVLERPLLGWGWDGYWSLRSDVQLVPGILPTRASEAHNAVLELLVAFGGPLGVVLVLLFFGVLWRSWTAGVPLGRVLPLMCLVYGFAGAILYDGTNPIWILTSFGILRLSQPVRTTPSRILSFAS
jgi:hypothetical protein